MYSQHVNVARNHVRKLMQLHLPLTSMGIANVLQAVPGLLLQLASRYNRFHGWNLSWAILTLGISRFLFNPQKCQHGAHSCREILLIIWQSKNLDLLCARKINYCSQDSRTSEPCSGKLCSGKHKVDALYVPLARSFK